ncbi:MAG: alpha/beta hydrolase family protein [Nocardioidaceae bacterium]
MGASHSRWFVTLLLCVVGATGCSGAPEQVRESERTTAAAAPRRASAPPAPSDTPTEGDVPAPSAGPTRHHAVSLPALMRHHYDGRRLRVGRVLARTDAYTRYAVSYLSGDLRISGIMNVPSGRGPFPTLVLNHGYIDPPAYYSGQGLSREQDYLARAGYVVLHTDYRNHASSDKAPASNRRLRLGYTVDVINALRALERSSLPYVDRDRLGYVGRSMGGGVTLNALVVRPGLVDTAVVYAPVSSDTVDNFERWIRGDPEQARLTRAIIGRYGAPERSPRFWRDVSPVTFFDRITAPVLVHHGTADLTCPIRWSRETVAALRRAGKDVRLHVYPGEPHTFIADWTLSMRRTVRFLEHNLRAAG